MFLWRDPRQPCQSTGPDEGDERGLQANSAEDTGTSSDAVDALKAEADVQTCQEDLQHEMLQLAPPRKPFKKILNARLPPKGQGEKQKEISDLPSEAWGLQALDAVEVTTESRSLENEINLTVKSESAGDVPGLQERPSFLPEDSSSVSQTPGWRLMTRSVVGIDAVKLLQLGPTASLSLDSPGCPASEAVDADQKSPSTSEFGTPMHDKDDAADHVAATPRGQNDVEENPLADAENWAPPPWIGVAQDASEPGEQAQVCPEEWLALKPELLEPIESCEPDSFQANVSDVSGSLREPEPLSPLPFKPEPGVLYARGWVKYCDPDSGELWFLNELTEEFFFAEYSREKGWKPFQCHEGRRWWWHDKNKQFFFEGLR